MALADVDIERQESLIAYLGSGGWIERDERPQVRVLHGGVSNKTVLVQRKRDGDAWVLKQALAKLRVPVDWFGDPMRIHREASALRWLERLAPDGAAPRLVFEDFEQHVLCMEAVPEPYENWKEKLLAGRVERDDIVQFGRLLGEMVAHIGDPAFDRLLARAPVEQGAPPAARARRAARERHARLGHVSPHAPARRSPTASRSGPCVRRAGACSRACAGGRSSST